MLFSILLVILSLFLLSVYAFINRPQKVIVADAQLTYSSTSKEQKEKITYLPYQNLCTPQGKVIYTLNYIRVLVNGTCMAPRGIMNGRQILVELLKEEQKLYFKKYVKTEDVLLIHLKDKDVYKLRILQNYEKNDKNDDELITYRYLPNGDKHRSSRNHRPADVVGVVRYVL